MNSLKDKVKPWLSIIIPIYNAEKYLSACLDSIKKQSFRDYEVILVDDGSTDSSATICKQYCSADKRFRYFPKNNEGSYQARLYGLDKITGLYFTFCDADDYYLTRRAFQILNDKANNGPYSVLQFSYTKRFNHLKHNCILSKKEFELDRNNFMLLEYPRLLCNQWDKAHLTTNVWNKLYNTNLIVNLEKQNEVKRVFWGDDLILNLQLLSACDSVCFIPDSLYCYRQFSGSTNKFSVHTMEDLDIIKSYQLKYLNKACAENEHYAPLRETIENRLNSEIASWLYLFICDACRYLQETEVIQLIMKTLSLDSFIQARQYYLKQNSENWEAVNLLREADPKSYIKSAENHTAHKTVKTKIKAILKKIYVSI